LQKYYLVQILENTNKNHHNKIMNINLFIETILVLFAILASNGILYSLKFFNLKKQNSSENISVITNSSEKDGLALTSLIASNPIRLTSSESSSSQTLSVTSSETNVSQTLSETSSETNVSQIFDIYDNDIWIDSEIREGIQITSLDSRTILDTQSFKDWREIVMDLHDHPINSPPGVLQQIKFEELNILYSQDIIHYAITQTELRLIIEHLPAMSLFNPDINHLILTMMSYYHG
jgi:hypothetical protein